MVVVLAGWLVALSVVDLREHRLPNALTLPGFVVILAVAFAVGRGTGALLGAVALAGLYLVLHLLGRDGMGAGDVKLALGLGAVTGAFGVDAWVVAALAAPLCTALWGLVTSARVLPHGPSMCLATAVSLAIWA
jgi:leader peptidase (prepilin peptidase) / N-methyltransferase